MSILTDLSELDVVTDTDFSQRARTRVEVVAGETKHPLGGVDLVSLCLVAGWVLVDPLSRLFPFKNVVFLVDEAVVAEVQLLQLRTVPSEDAWNGI